MILAIETTTQVCSVSLTSEGENTALYELSIEQAHSKALTVMIQQLMDSSGLDKAQLTAVAISQGPGSYTGLRIGTSVAKGLCYALEIPLIAVDTLQAMAKGVADRFTDTGMCFAPMMDARRMEVYTALYDSSLHTIQSAKPVILTDEVPFPDHHATTICYFGDGAGKAQQALPSETFHYIPGVRVSAKEVGLLAWELQQKNIYADLVYFEPHYLKKFLVKPSKKNLLPTQP